MTNIDNLKNKNIIEIKNFTKYYGKICAVKDLNLKVKKGSIFGFIGPNSAGKTTTIRTMLDYIVPDKGNITIFGLDSKKFSKKIKLKTGYVPSENYLYPYLTGYKHLKLTAEFYKLKKNIFLENINKYSNYFAIDLNKKVKELSHGNKRKLFLINALLHNPQLLILDEPSNGLGPVLQKRLHILLKKLSEKGITIFLSSHNLNEVENLCSDIAIIKDGQLIYSLNIKKFLKQTNNNLEKIFEKYFKKEIGDFDINDI